MDNNNPTDPNSDPNSQHNNLRNLNKLSHKITKPNNHNNRNNLNKPQQQSDQSPEPLQPPQQQPPVYNINKNDFREVVQKLTGSTSHQTPPPKPSSRLHRIRPPPLAQIGTQNQNLVYRPQQPPMSPLPPFPSVHGAAESPISAYLRFFKDASGTAGTSLLPPPSPLAFGCFSPPAGFGSVFPVSPVPSPGNNAN